MTEADIHRAVVKELRDRGAGGVWFHCPNEGKKSARRAGQSKNFGVRKGVSDIIAYKNREAFALELKRPGYRATVEQLEFQAEWRANGGHAVVAEGRDEAIAILEAWGLLRKGAA